MRTSATVCRAELACRSLPRLSRCRVVLPDDAGCRVDAAECGEAGLVTESFGVPAGRDEQSRGDVRADAELPEQCGCCLLGELGDRGVEVAIESANS